MISVAMATYNGEQFLKEQLDSIFTQSLPVDEVIICDDCSRDNTVSILNEYKKKYSQIKIFENNENLGYKQNFKKALSLCSGDYIFLCDQDDVWYEDKVKLMIDIMNSNSNILSLASSFSFIDSDDKKVTIQLIPGRSNNNFYLKEVANGDLVEVSLQEFMLHNYFQGCSLVITKEIKDWFVENFSEYLPHDWLINLYASYKCGMYFYNKSLFDYRIHKNNTIGVDMNVELNDQLNKQFKSANSEYTRTLVTKSRIDVLEATKKSIPELYKKNNYTKLLDFCYKHVNAIQDRNLYQLIMLNFNPNYYKIKKMKGRLMDLFFVIKHKKNK